jgi:DNA polymerase-3 subunit beta
MIDAKVKIPILDNVLVEARQDAVQIITTDLDVALSVGVMATVVEPGTTCVPAGQLADLVDSMPDDACVKLEQIDRGLTIRCGRSRYVLPTLPGDFPSPLTAGPDAVEIELDKKATHSLFVDPTVSISTEQTRYYLCGIYLHSVAGMLAAVATDGRTLVLTKTDLPAPEMPGVIVPSKAVGELARMGKNGINLRINNKIIEAYAGLRRVASKLVNGTFPDYRRILPKPSNNTAEIDRDDLIAALNRIRAVADSSAKPSPCGLRWSDGGEIELVLAGNPEAASDALAATISGGARVAVSIDLLADLLESFDGAERVRLDVTNPASPIMVTVVDRPGLLTVVMPMASQWTTAKEAA